MKNKNGYSLAATFIYYNNSMQKTVWGVDASVNVHGVLGWLKYKVKTVINKGENNSYPSKMPESKKPVNILKFKTIS